MASKWPIITLEEASLGIYDCPHSTPKLSDSGPFMVRTQDIRQGFFDTSNAVQVSEDVYRERTKRIEPKQGDLLFSREGTYFGDAAEVPENTRVCLGQRMVLIRPNPKLFRSSYLRAQINSPSFQVLISQRRDGTVAERLNLPAIRSLPVRVPPLDFQDFAVDHISSFERKIELNRQINATLEAMAQALFKSWFVDFDPVIDNALAAGNPIPEPLQSRARARKALGDERKPLPDAIQKQFPDHFVFNEDLGWVPEGWEVEPFGNLIEETIGGDWGKEKQDSKHTRSVVIIRGTDIPSVQSGQKGAAPSRWVEEKKFQSRQLLDGDLVLEVSGGSPKQPTGRSVYITKDTLKLFGGDIVPASFCRKLRPKTKELGLYSSLHLNRIYALGKMWGYQNQSTGISNFQTKTFLIVEPVLLPKGNDLLGHFFDLVRPLVDRARSHDSEKLTQIRDTLLPKLLSGQLRIPDAEKQVAKVI